MLINPRPLLGFLYGLLFVSFIGMSLGPTVGGWISTNYGGLFTIAAVAAYGAYLLGLIWVINRINKSLVFEPPSAWTSRPMSLTEMEFIRRQAKTTEQWDGGSGDPPPLENGDRAKFKL